MRFFESERSSSRGDFRLHGRCVDFKPKGSLSRCFGHIGKLGWSFIRRWGVGRGT